MTIEQIDSLIKTALQDHNVRSKNLWRSVKNKALTFSKLEKVEPDESVCGRALKSELKQLEQTLNSVPDDSTLAAETKQNIEELNSYLPKQLTDEELKRSIEAIVMTMPKGSNFGMRMKKCMEKLSEVADGKRISDILKNL